MMIATCSGPSARSGSSVAGTAAFDIDQSFGTSSESRTTFKTTYSLNGEDFLFLRRKQLIDFRNRSVGRLLHVVRETLLIVFGNLMILLELLDRVEAVAPDVPDGDTGRLRIFVRDFDQLFTALLVEFGNSKSKHLPFRRRAQTKIGIDDCLLYRLDHRLVPHLHRKQARLGHADGRKLVERHVCSVGIDLYRLQHRRRGAAGSQTPEFVLERVRGALHAALQFVDIETTR